ncbi:MAG: chemotaxis protein CheW [Nitrospirota bacterium]
MIAQQAEQSKSGAPAAAEKDVNGVTEDFCQLVTCRVGREEFAVDILSVQEINRMVEITKVPKAPSFVEGVINLRGRIIPVLDLRRRLGIPEAGRTAQSRIVVVNVGGRVIGLVVDAVSEVLRIPRSTIEPPPSTGASAGAEFIQGVGKINDRLLTLLDLKRLLTPEEQAAA